MYKLSVTLNEPNEEPLILRVADSPLLQLTVYNHDGTTWPAGYTATLRIGRSNRDPDIWEIDGIATDDDHIWLFQLEDVTYTIGDYDAILYLYHAAEATPDFPEWDLTPVPALTPIEDIYEGELDYSFLPIILEVR